MKIFKLALFSFFILFLGWFIWKSFHNREISPSRTEFIKSNDSDFTLEIKAELDTFDHISKNSPSTNIYRAIGGKIERYHEQNLFSSDNRDNDRIRDKFLKQLFSVYSSHYIQYAKSKFKIGSCFYYDYRNIELEVLRISKSSFLEKGTLNYRELRNIRVAISNHREINHFISTCSDFSFFHDSLAVHFPIDSVKAMLDLVEKYKDLFRTDKLLKSCKRIIIQLDSVPTYFFNAHYNFLRNKIEKNSQRYSEFTTQSDHKKFIVEPLLAEIESFRRNVYGIDDMQARSFLNKLKDLVDRDAVAAFEKYSKDIKN